MSFIVGNIVPISNYRQCKYNEWVECESKLTCMKCGWNPSVAKERLDAIIAKRNRRDG